MTPDALRRLSARPRLWSPVEGLQGPEGWPARQRTIRTLWRRWLLGPYPAPAAPARAEDLGAGRLLVHAGGAAIRAQLLVPRRDVRAPVLMVQGRHTEWAHAAASRGLAAIVVSADDEADDADALAPLLGPARLARRAWALSRVLDVLPGRAGMDAARVAVAGHSRNGKAALIATAFDERFAAVVSSSSGVLGAIPVRRCCDRHFGEGVDLLVRHYPDWFHPRLGLFAGHEHLLPTDAHELLALAAPRPVLVATATGDQVESVPAAREAVALAGEAHAVLGAAGAVELALRPGDHAWSAQTVEGYLDWIEDVLGPAPRRRTAPAPAPVPLVPLPRTFFAARRRPADLRDAVAALLPEGPQAARPAPALALPGRVQAPAVELLGTAGAPTALWLGPPCRATGWRAGYEQAVPLPELLARDGWRVACQDPVGSGARADEPGGLAEMLADARVLLDRTGPVWVAAYGTGAVVAAHLAALDERVLGAALVAPTCGEPLVRPGAEPLYGLGDLLAAAGARPLLVLDPRVDPEAPSGAVAWACRAAGVERVPLHDWHRLSGPTREAVREWLAAEGARVRRAA